MLVFPFSRSIICVCVCVCRVYLRTFCLPCVALLPPVSLSSSSHFLSAPPPLLQKEKDFNLKPLYFPPCCYYLVHGSVALVLTLHCSAFNAHPALLLSITQYLRRTERAPGQCIHSLLYTEHLHVLHCRIPSPLDVPPPLGSPCLLARRHLRDAGERAGEHGRAGLQVCRHQHQPEPDPDAQHHAHLRHPEDQPVRRLRGVQERCVLWGGASA